ncbi:MAG: hypothetical protein K2J78_04350 [Muribaculaceae bacterium]|nr:hypothetical protein [Muribaculaceae bacterium]
MKKSLLLGAALTMAAGAMAQLAPGEYYIKNVETGMFLNEGFSWGTHAVTKAYPCAFDITLNAPQEEGEWKLVGIEDNSTPFWSTWGEYVDLIGDGTLHYEFYNYNGGHTNNWENWALVLTNGLKRGEEGYSEYMYLRADAYGWGTAYNHDTDHDKFKNDFEWETFPAEMDGAFVTVDITRAGTEVTVDAKIKAKSGVERYESITLEGINTEVLGTFLTCEGSHLLVNPEVYGDIEEVAENYTVKSAYGYIKIEGEPYMDGGAPTPVYLESVGEAYNIKVADKYLTAQSEIVEYLGYTPLHVVDATDEPTGNLSAWQIISREEMIAELAKATSENPVEASFFLNAGQIEVNARNNISSWTYIKNGEPSEIVTPDGGWFDHGAWDNKTTYAWCINEEGENKDHQAPVAGVDVVSQDVEGMPAGNYKAEYRVVNQANTALVVKFNDAEGKPYEYEESDLWYNSAWDAIVEHAETAEFTVGEDGKLSIKMEKTIDPEQQNRFAFKSFALYYLGDGSTGVANIAVDENAPVEYYNMQGIRVANPTNGLYIKRQGKKATKVIVK